MGPLCSLPDLRDLDFFPPFRWQQERQWGKDTLKFYNADFLDALTRVLQKPSLMWWRCGASAGMVMDGYGKVAGREPPPYPVLRSVHFVLRLVGLGRTLVRRELYAPGLWDGTAPPTAHGREC